MTGSSSLSLDYAFTTTPTPILASPDGGNPNTVTLQVMVSSPSFEDVTVTEIDIEIPLGTDAGDLSTVTNLPPVSGNTQATTWSISTSGDTVTILPTGTGLVDTPIVFTVENISVSDVPGTVNLQITEHPSSNSDTTTYTLVKQPSNCPLLTFSVTPGILTDLDKSVKLHWTCTTAGQTDKKYSYRLSASLDATQARSETRHPRTGPSAATPQFSPGHGAGGTYTAKDGECGVTYGPVEGTTTFTVSAYYAESVGNSVDAGDLTTAVQVQLPSFATATYAQQSVSGQFASLHWLAFNADSCKIQVDGKVGGDTLPTDMYERGSWVMLDATANTHELMVIAQSKPDNGYPVTADSNTFTVQTEKPVQINLANGPSTAAITPDSTVALVGTGGDGTVHFLPLTTTPLAFSTTAVQVGSGTPAIAITPDGAQAIVANLNSGTVSRIDIASQTLVQPHLTDISAPEVVAVTTDSTLALVGELGSGLLYLIDLHTWSVKTTIPIGQSPAQIAVTPDGLRALVPDMGTGNIAIVDLKKYTSDLTTLNVGEKAPTAIAITPDGTRALVTLSLTSVLAIVDLSTHTVETTTYPTGTSPTAIAITPDGRYAFIANYDSTFISVFDIVNLTMSMLPTGLGAGSKQTAIALAPRGTAVLVACQGSNAVMAF